MRGEQPEDAETLDHRKGPGLCGNAPWRLGASSPCKDERSARLWSSLEQQVEIDAHHRHRSARRRCINVTAIPSRHVQRVSWRPRTVIMGKGEPQVRLGVHGDMVAQFVADQGLHRIGQVGQQHGVGGSPGGTGR